MDEEMSFSLGSQPEETRSALYSNAILLKSLRFRGRCRGPVWVFTAVLAGLMVLISNYAPELSVITVLLLPWLASELLVVISRRLSLKITPRPVSVLGAFASLTLVASLPNFVQPSPTTMGLAVAVVWFSMMTCFFCQYVPLIASIEGKALGPAFRQGLRLALSNWLELIGAYARLFISSYFSFMLVVVSLSGSSMLLPRWLDNPPLENFAIGLGVLVYVAAGLEVFSTWLAFQSVTYWELRSRQEQVPEDQGLIPG